MAKWPCARFWAFSRWPKSSALLPPNKPVRSPWRPAAAAVLFVRRYLERHPLALSLRQVDPLIRQLTPTIVDPHQFELIFDDFPPQDLVANIRAAKAAGLVRVTDNGVFHSIHA